MKPGLVYPKILESFSPLVHENQIDNQS